jgi:flagellar biosynthesis protein FlhB
MSESLQDKTEAATPKKRDESHRKGEVPRSQELSTAAILLASALVLRFAGPGAVDAIGNVFAFSATIMPVKDAAIPDVSAWLHHVMRTVALGTAPILFSLAAVSLAVNVAQARGVLSADKLKPQFSRLAPHTNLKRIFGIRSVVELLKSLLKLLVVSTAMYTVFRRAWPEIMAMSQVGPGALARAIASYSASLLFAAGLAYIALAAFDYAYQVWNHEKQMRMTKEEVKRETKETDGDPLVKSRMRSLGRSLLRKQMFADVPKADVVVTNPTHIAVALRYDPSISAAPIVLALGQRKIAERIKTIAREAGVPVIENKPLARALLATAKVGLPIPAELYVAVAEVLAFVIRRRAAAVETWSGSELA